MNETDKYGLYIHECADVLTENELKNHLEKLREMYYLDCKKKIKVLSNQI